MKTTPKQNLMLLRLAVLGPEKASLLTPAAERNRLAQNGWIEGTRRHRATYYDLTDQGWEWINDLESIQLPSTKAAVPLLEALFRLVQRRFHAQGETLAELHLPVKGSWDGERADPVPLAQRIREAYQSLAQNAPGSEVKLSHLKAKLAETDSETLDLCLLGLVMAGRAELRQIDEPLALSPEDRVAAIHFGGCARHLFRSLS
ncbi:MAG: hypothetical protein SNJ84_06760 [Verrucomicrobiia bacterium]